MSERNPISIIDRIKVAPTEAELDTLMEEFRGYGFASVNTTSKVERAYRERKMTLTKEAK